MRSAAACVATVVLGLAACGGGSSGSSASCTPGSTAALTVTATGLSPINVCVLPGGTVTFTNSDPSAAHDIVFDTANCPTVGNISPNGAHVMATFPTQENCTFHDANNPNNTAFRGTVAVTPGTVTGGGY
jgi:plastocyanin